MKRDDFVRRLWLAGYEFLVDLQTGQRFWRESDSAEILVPKDEEIDSKWAEMRLRGVPDGRARHPSPCCGVESRLRRIIGLKLMLFRCMNCEKMWEKTLGEAPRLKVVD